VFGLTVNYFFFKKKDSCICKTSDSPLWIVNAFFIKRGKKIFSLGSFGYSVNSEKDINLNELNILNKKNNINFNTQKNENN
jgi:hypothetical protein